MMLVDHTRLNYYERTFDNNFFKVPIHIELTSPPDLQVTSFEVPSQGAPGQPIFIKWEVENKGSGSTVSKNWRDKIYLSTDLEWDDEDLPLKGVSKERQILNPGESYRDSIAIILPNNVEGNYVIILKTDENEIEFELDKEDNNTVFSLIFIEKPEPSDLIASQVSFPLAGSPGQEITVNWQISNIGINPATGYRKDAIYFSKDTVWDVTDKLFGILETKNNIVPQGTINDSLKSKIDGLEIGDYYVIVKTDLLNQISETDDTNNTLVSLQQINIDVKQLKRD